MKVLMVEPGKSPYETEIEGGLESLQAAVGGDIQATYPFDDLVGLICNDEGKLIGLPLNRALYDDEGHLYDIVPGNFLIVGLGEEDFTDLPADLIEKYTERFKYPEKFFRLAGEIVAVKQPLPPEEKQQPASVMEEPGRDDIRLDDTTDLAFDLDEFFRQNSGAYADLYPDSHAEKERMADELLSGDTGKIRMRLAAFEREEHMEGKTAKSILISCGARLAPFDIKEVREITMYDELELDLVGDRKTALFFIISDTDATFNFLVSMAYTQLFNLLCERADDKYGGRLPVHVRCLIDEAANIGQIPNLEKLMATIRSREISACLVLQAQSQLKALYKDNMDTIIGNCDASLFLGGKEETTLKSWNSLLGKETIDMYNTSVTKGTQESHGQNFQKLGKDLMSVDELAVMDGGKCLLQIRGVRPFLSRKYDITRHPNYRLLSDFNEKNAFDIEKFLSTKMPMRPGELYRNYEVTAEDLEAPAI